MKLIREIAVAGHTVYENVKVSSGNHKRRRRIKTYPTPEPVKKNNDRNAARHLTLLMNANFDEHSAHYILTYAGKEPTYDEATRDLKNYLRRLSYAAKKVGCELRYIAVTEYRESRVHHHVVLNTLDIELVSTRWKEGFVERVPLDGTGHYKDLAEYFIKETSITIRDEGTKRKRRWSASQNLIRPELQREVVDASVLSDDPTPIQGYTIPKTEIYRYQHPVTGLMHRECYMVADRRYSSKKVNVSAKRESGIPGTACKKLHYFSRPPVPKVTLYQILPFS